MKSLILASQSPRRYDLLQAAGYEFVTKKYDVEEVYPEDLTDAAAIAVYLAELKSKRAQQEMDANQVVLTADTIVVLDGSILGKPKDRNDAIHTLSSLSDRTHQVITAVSIAHEGGVTSAYDMSTVHFCPLTQNEIEFYIDTFDPMDKAGSYGIQDWLGLCKVKGIEGSNSNIMGLPMELVFRMLSEVGVYPTGL